MASGHSGAILRLNGGGVVAKVVDGIPKRDAAKELGISERTLGRKLSNLQIECKQLRAPGRRPLVVIPTADFARVKAALIPVGAAPTPEETTALTVRPSRPTQELMALLRTSLQAPPLPLFLTCKRPVSIAASRKRTYAGSSQRARSKRSKT